MPGIFKAAMLGRKITKTAYPEAKVGAIDFFPGLPELFGENPGNPGNPGMMQLPPAPHEVLWDIFVTVPFQIGSQVFGWGT